MLYQSALSFYIAYVKEMSFGNTAFGEGGGEGGGMAEIHPLKWKKKKKKKKKALLPPASN